MKIGFLINLPFIVISAMDLINQVMLIKFGILIHKLYI